MKITAFCLCWLLILTAPGVMAQQTTAAGVTAQQTTVPNQSWDLLRQLQPVVKFLQPGEKLQVERKTGKKKVSGEFISLSDTELVIERKRKNVSFTRDEVKNIWRVAPPSRKKQMIFGAIGGVVGFLAGVATLVLVLTQEECGGGCLTAALAALTGIPVVGVVVGVSLAGSDKRTLIYSAQ